MLANFLTVGQQVIILFILIGAGFASGKAGLVGEKGVKGMTNVVLYLATPCIIITSFQDCKFNSDMLFNLGIMCVITVAIYAFSIVMATLIFKDKDIARRSVFRVATVFSNCGFMSLPLQKAILGADGVFYGAIYVAIFNIVVWTYGLVTMSGNTKDLSIKRLLTNPGIVGVAVAILLWVLNIQLPEILDAPVRYLGALNTPVPMVIIGCQLASINLKTVFIQKRNYLCYLIRLVVIPLVTLFALVAVGVKGSMLVATVIATSAPVAATTSMFATKYNKDTTLAVSLISATTIISLVTMPVIVALSQLFS